MALQTVVEPWFPIISASKQFYFERQLPVVTPAKSGSIFLYTFLPFKPGSPYWSIASEISFQGFFGYAVERESLYMSSPL
jgi:hypothetical protein